MNCHGVVAPHPMRRARRYWMGPRAVPVFLCYGCAYALRRGGMDVVSADRRSEERPEWTEAELAFARG